MGSRNSKVKQMRWEYVILLSNIKKFRYRYSCMSNKVNVHDDEFISSI